MGGVQIGCVILTLVTFSYAIQCYEKKFDGTSKTKMCPYLCCGSSTYFRHCCGSSSTVDDTLDTGAIVGISFGVIAFTSIIVGIIICHCRSPRGQNQQQLNVVLGTRNTAYSPGYGYPVQSTSGAYPPAPNDPKPAHAP
ncbi:cysteine and tyrosine-rich protein 1-like [Haliotis cracherodii]|uniref:cysteine and tyrosine-rich protein 1-like n=1 Tax=Haliotis cracherodii TaxID=6455 RepID=UPI0039EC3F3B